MCLVWSNVFIVNVPYWHPTPGEDPNWYFTPCVLIILNSILHRRLLKILLPMSIRLTHLHLLWSDGSPLFGTGTIWPSCHSSKSMLSFQNSRMKLKWTFRFSGDIALEALGDTPFSPGALLLVRYFTASVNYFQEVGTSSSFVTSREFMLFRTLLLIYLLSFTLKSTTYALALKPKPLVVCSSDRGRDLGSLKKWHRSPRLWHRLPRLACSKTKTIGSA